MRTGRLRASIKADPPRVFTLRPSVTIGSNVEYAEWVHDGTRRHFIRPKTVRTKLANGKYKGGVLRFVVGGRVVYARVVDHPGTKPRPFLDRALREVARSRGYSFRTDGN